VLDEWLPQLAAGAGIRFNRGMSGAAHRFSNDWKFRGRNFQWLEVSAAGVLAALLANSSLAAQDIALDQAINIALKQNRDLKALEYGLDSRNLSIESAKLEFSFKLHPEGEVRATDDGEAFRGGVTAEKKGLRGTQAQAAGLFSESPAEGDQDLSAGLVRVEVRQPLLKNRGLLVNREPITSAESRSAAAHRDLELRRADVVVRVVESHETLLRLQQQIDFDRQTLDRYDRLSRLTRAREKQGRTTRVDTLRVDFQRGRAELSLSATRQRLASLQRDFADLLGFPPETEFAAVGGEQIDLQVPPAQEAMGIALSNRLEYAQALQDLDDARRGVLIARHNILPRLDLVARYERTAQGADLQDALDLEGELWSIGLAGDTDVFRREERLAERQSIIDEETAALRREISESTVRREVLQALIVYEQAVQEVAMAGRNFDLAGERAALTRRLFEMGREDNFSVTDAETELLQAQVQMLQARAQRTVAAYGLLQVLGTLVESPERLKPGANDVGSVKGQVSRGDAHLPLATRRSAEH